MRQMQAVGEPERQVVMQGAGTFHDPHVKQLVPSAFQLDAQAAKKPAQVLGTVILTAAIGQGDGDSIQALGLGNAPVFFGDIANLLLGCA